VPIRMSTPPAAATASRICAARRGAEAAQHLDRDRVARHALAERVEVLLREDGRRHEDATCLPACTALKAARRATSVLPKPTSPQIRRSIGRGAPCRALVSSIARSWSGVSVKGKDASNSPASRCPAGNAKPGWASRLAWIRSSSAARSRVARSTARRAFSQRPVPIARAAACLAQADVAADQVRLLEGDVERHAVVELERDHLAQALGGLDLRQAAVEGDPVLEVDDEVALDQLGEVEQLVDLGDEAPRAPPAAAAGPLAAEDLGLGDEHEARAPPAIARPAPRRAVALKPSFRLPRRKRGRGPRGPGPPRGSRACASPRPPWRRRRRPRSPLSTRRAGLRKARRASSSA
jgi:hypothetical protein